MSVKKIGILGGGQLAQMLAVAASANLGIPVSILSESKDSPAGSVCADIMVDSISVESLLKFISNVDIVVFESEFVDVSILKQVESRPEFEDKKFLPSLDTMQILQDKLKQKELCVDNKIPTSRYKIVYSGGDPAHIDFADLKKSFGNQAVLKWSRLGYDGKGNFFVSDWESQKNQIIDFCKLGAEKDAVTYAEEKIKFTKEVAIVAVQSTNGESVNYPLVISEQLSGTCLNVFGPAASFDVSQVVEEQAKSIAGQIAKVCNLTGTFAIEFFLTEDNKLLVNEIAPRVHNTGHYTQDCAKVCQFENHIRAVLGYPLGSTEYRNFFGMRNILGPEKIDLNECAAPIPAASSNLHWYNKGGTRHKRKLGHINVCADSKKDFQDVWQAALKDEQIWIKSL